MAAFDPVRTAPREAADTSAPAVALAPAGDGGPRLAASRRRTLGSASWLLMPGIVASLGVVAVGLLAGAIHLSEDQATSFEMADALGQLRNRISTSHLWLEEAVAGDSKERVVRDLADLGRIADLVALGGPGDFGPDPAPPPGSELGRQAREVRVMVDEWRALVARALGDLTLAAEGSDLERRADQLFEALQEKTAAMETVLRHDYANRARHTRALLLALVVVWCGVVIITTSVVFVRELRRVAMQRQLARSNIDLERRVAARTRALQELNGQLLTAQETERRRVATELHDALGHTLVLAKLGVAGLQAEIGGDPGPAAGLTELAATLDQAIDETHRLAHDLRPAALENLGLTAALRLLSENGITRGGTRVEAHIDDVDDAIPDAAHVVVYRIVQEALTNVTKHAHATRVSILVRRRDGVLEAVVEDDGSGFDTTCRRCPGARGGFGVATMQERARLLGGRLDVTSAVGRGTRIHLEIPSPNGAVRS